MVGWSKHYFTLTRLYTLKDLIQTVLGTNHTFPTVYYPKIKVDRKYIILYSTFFVIFVRCLS